MPDQHPTGSTSDVGRDPSDTSLLSVLKGYEAAGFTAQFAARDGALVHCFPCGTDSAADRCAAGPVRRLEGASDPADMLAVLPVRCPACQAHGVVVMNYGPESSIADAEVLVSLDRRASGRELGG